MTQETVDVRERHIPLYDRYEETPEDAKITDRAVATGGVDMDPFHGAVEPGSQDYEVAWEFGIHRAVGGYHDAPSPGESLLHCQPYGRMFATSSNVATQTPR